MWDSLVVLLGIQAGGMVFGFLVGYYLGRKHKLIGLMDRDEYVKQYDNY
jgi:hypothetical protein